MSKHRMVNGKLLQMNKSYGQLKQKQKVKITEWMYQAYKRQAVEGLSDEAALQIVMEKIEQAGRSAASRRDIRRYRRRVRSCSA